MEYLVAGLVLAAVVTALNLVLTVAVMRRWRARVGAAAAAHEHGPDQHGASPPHDHGPELHGHATDLGIAAGHRMPEFTAATASGGTLTRDDLAGRPVLFGFLSLDCASCDESVPAFAEYARRVRDAGGQVVATVVGVDAGDSEMAARLADIADHVVPEFLDAPVGGAFGVLLYPGFAQYGPDGVATAAALDLAELAESDRPLVP
ncbi:TlpA family protein disulfide reductase [Actinomadura rupiterrae]|uniref:TlpA family protein disulfide reductase n=1 Tax=Actinomadura rupiterrae TaxID=559627 RepID=UPI0020A30396|nr:redoxin domain-containing protein [Actinomadura rupiterrae]MCP2342826.1 thiol-disulfide isomerase/thioredoxin [Actinomadura rupiterrae]